MQATVGLLCKTRSICFLARDPLNMDSEVIRANLCPVIKEINQLDWCI